MSLPTLGLVSLAAQLHIPTTHVLAAAQAGPLGLAFALWLFVRRGGMVSRAAVVGMWLLAAAGLAGVAMIPAHLGSAAMPVMGACMALVGIGSAVGYHTQANVLALVNARTPGEPEGGERAVSEQGPGPGSDNGTSDEGNRAPRPQAGEAAGLAQSWTLSVGVSTTLLAGFVIDRVGIRPVLLGVAVLMGLYAVVHIWWRGLPEKQAGVGAATVVSLLRQSTEVKRDTLGSLVLYGAWGTLYPVVALLGAGPLVQASILAAARGIATLFVAGLGRLADREGQRLVRLAAAAAGGGVVILVIFRSLVAWLPAGAGVATAEIGANAVAGVIKARHARGEDTVRQEQLGFMFRFLGFGLAPLSIDELWSTVSPHHVVEARVLVAVSVVVLQLAELAIVPWLVRRPSSYPIKEPGLGVIEITVFQPRRNASHAWFHARIEGGSEGRFFALRPGERLTMEDRDTDTRLLLVDAHVRKATGRRRGPGLHARNGTWQTSDRGATSLPPAGPAGIPWRAFDMIADGVGGQRWLVGRLSRTTVEPVTVTSNRVLFRRLPAPLADAMRMAPTEMMQDIEPGFARTYRLASRAFGSDQPGVDGRAWLRVNSHVFTRRHTDD